MILDINFFFKSWFYIIYKKEKYLLIKVGNF